MSPRFLAPTFLMNILYTRIEKGSPQTGADTLHTLCNLIEQNKQATAKPCLKLKTLA
jgi:hypothetical protein